MALGDRTRTRKRSDLAEFSINQSTLNEVIQVALVYHLQAMNIVRNADSIEHIQIGKVIKNQVPLKITYRKGG